MTPIRIIPLAVLSLTFGCSEWPRSTHLPQVDFGEPATDVRALVNTTWTEISEVVDSPIPAPNRTILTVGNGVHITGALDGTGWNDNAPARIVHSPNCDTDALLSLGIDGDWTGDVDAFGLEIPSGLQLCTDIRGPSNEVGWDLVLIAVDDCTLPVRAILSGDSAIGLGLGAETGWSTVVEAGNYQLFFAAYSPVVPEQRQDYTLSISAVPASTDGLLSPCPLPLEDAQR